MNKLNLFDTLKAKPIEELRDLARKSGLTPHHKAKPETLARQIVEATAPKPTQQHAPVVKEAPYMHSEEEVRAMLEPYKNITLRFPGDGTFIMSNGKAEDSLHLTTPVAVILGPKHARLINRGELRPISMDEAARRGVSNATCMG